MRPDELAAHSRKQAAENDTAVLTALAAAGDTGIRPGGELAGAAGLPETTARVVVARLVTRGLARRDGKRRIWATAAGCAEAGAGTPGPSLAPALDDAIGCLPAEALRAFTRLQVAAIPVRWHFAREIADGWPAFISIGPTSTGKTAIARLICRIYGLEPLVAIRAAFRETAGSLVGRRERDAQSPTGWRVEPSPVLSLPYVAIDEWDKASAAVQAAAGGLLMGDTADVLERERFEIRPTPYITLNASREGLHALHDAHVRRSVVLDTGPLQPLLRDLDEDVARLLGGVVIPHLHLDRIRPPMASLPADLRALLRSELHAGLTERGRQLTDVETLSRLALGRSAITGGSLEDAALATAADYLTCASTLGWTQNGFAARLAPKLGGRGTLLPDAAAGEAEAGHRQTIDRDRRRRTVEEALEFVWLRERAAAATIEWRDAMGRTRDPDRQALARVLTSAAESIRGARSLEALRAAMQATAPYGERPRLDGRPRPRRGGTRAGCRRGPSESQARQPRSPSRSRAQANRTRLGDDRAAHADTQITTRSGGARAMPGLQPGLPGPHQRRDTPREMLCLRSPTRRRPLKGLS